MKNIIVLKNPVLQTILNELRKEDTISTEFRLNLRYAGYLMTYEIIGGECTKKQIKVKTVFTKTSGFEIKEKILQIIVMRAGEPFTEGGARLLDEIKSRREIGVVDARRIETGKDLEMDIEITSFKVPKFDKNTIIIVFDPMLATGSTLIKILKELRKRGKYKKLIVCCIIATPYGIKKLQREIHGVKIYALAIDKGGKQGLNNKGYIIPGLGDCGDRAFGSY